MNEGNVLFSDEDEWSDDCNNRIPDIKLDLCDKIAPSTSTETSRVSKRELDPIFLEMIKPMQRYNIFTREVAPRDSFNPYVEMEFLRAEDLASSRPRPFCPPDRQKRPGTPESIVCHQRRRERLLQEIYGNCKQKDNDEASGEYNPGMDGHQRSSTSVTPGKMSLTDCTTPIRSLRRRRKPRVSMIESDSDEELSLVDPQKDTKKSVNKKRTTDEHNVKRRNSNETDDEYNPEIDGHRCFSPIETSDKTSSTECTPMRSLRRCRKPRVSIIDSDSDEELSLIDIKKNVMQRVNDEGTPHKPNVSRMSNEVSPSTSTATRIRAQAKASSKMSNHRSTVSKTPSLTPAETEVGALMPNCRVTLHTTPSRFSGKSICEVDLFSTDEDDRLILDDILTDESDENAEPNTAKNSLLVTQGSAEKMNEEFANFKTFSPEVTHTPECSPCRTTPSRRCKGKTLTFIKKMLMLQQPSPGSPEKSRSRKRPRRRLPFSDKFLDEGDDKMLAELLPLKSKRMQME